MKVNPDDIVKYKKIQSNQNQGSGDSDDQDQDDNQDQNDDEDLEDQGDDQDQDGDDQDQDGDDQDQDGDDEGQGGDDDDEYSGDGETMQVDLDDEIFDEEAGMFGNVEEGDPSNSKMVENEIKKSLSNGFSSLPGPLQEYVKKFILTTSKVDWKTILASLVDTISQKYKYVMGNKRFIHQEIYIYGNKHESELEKIVVAVDISGSITEKMAEVFTNELNNIMSNVEYDELIVLYCDTAVQEKYTTIYKKGEPIKIKFISGGGTAFQPVFDWVKKKNFTPSVLIYFTDLEGPIPKKPDWYDRVIWGCTVSRGSTSRDFSSQKDSVKNFGEFVPIEI